MLGWAISGVVVGGNCSENVWGGFNVFLLNFLTFEIESHFTCGELNLY